MPLPHRPVDGRLAHRPRPGGISTGKTDIREGLDVKNDIRGDVYAELSGLQYTIHLSKRAVVWIGGMEKLFKAYLKASTAVIEELAPLADAIGAYIQTEAESIKAVSHTVSDGRVKLEGYLPDPFAIPEPDEGYVPPGGWNPPDPVNGLRWWTVNSINLYKNRWLFTATNSNPDDTSVKSVYFSTEYDGNSMHITPRDFRSTYGWTGLKGWTQFDSGLDTCTFVPRTGMWWLFSGTYCARTNGYGDSVTWSPSKLTDTWRGLARIDNGEFGQEEKKNWANGISCVTARDDFYVFIAGNRVVFLEASTGDMVDGISPWDRPMGLTEAWPALTHLDDAGIMDGQGPKAVCWDTSGNSNKWFLVFHSTLFSNYPDDSDWRGGFGYNFMACQSDTANSYYSWNSMFNYLNSPWPYPSCD